MPGYAGRGRKVISQAIFGRGKTGQADHKDGGLGIYRLLERVGRAFEAQA